MKTLAFHGTSKKCAEKIFKEGFKPGTWFAIDLDPAIRFGGTHVFTVMFDKEGLPDNWQFQVSDEVPPDKIVEYSIYRRKVIFESITLREALVSA